MSEKKYYIAIAIGDTPKQQYWRNLYNGTGPIEEAHPYTEAEVEHYGMWSHRVEITPKTAQPGMKLRAITTYRDGTYWYRKGDIVTVKHRSDGIYVNIEVMTQNKGLQTGSFHPEDFEMYWGEEVAPVKAVAPRLPKRADVDKADWVAGDTVLLVQKISPRGAWTIGKTYKVARLNGPRFTELFKEDGTIAPGGGWGNDRFEKVEPTPEVGDTITIQYTVTKIYPDGSADLKTESGKAPVTQVRDISDFGVFRKAKVAKPKSFKVGEIIRNNAGDAGWKIEFADENGYLIRGRVSKELIFITKDEAQAYERA